jgi:cell division transport system permease protein
MKEEMGEDFISFLGDNPLPPSIDVYLFAGYTNRDSVGKFERYILEYPFVKEVWYEDSLLYLINENVRKISVFLLIISSFLFLIAVTIINNTIRLAIYSKRFLIRTMQLVGATRSFIRKPFLVRSVYHGVLASLVAMLLLIALLYLIEKEFLMLFSFESAKLLIVLSVFLVLAGILINIVSTYLSVNRYLDMSEDKLYN